MSEPIEPELRQSIEQFLYEEADRLDRWDWAGWRDLLHPGIRYLCVTRPNLYHRDLRKLAQAGVSAATPLFDETYASLCERLEQLGEHNHWAQNPGTRTRHMVTNIRVTRAADPGSVSVQSNFYLHVSKNERQVDQFVGQRLDVLRRHDGPLGWRLAERMALVDMSTVLAANISTLF